MGERTREDGKEIREMRGSQHGDVDRGVERGEVNVVYWLIKHNAMIVTDD
jgi:hypothetical protein